MVGALSNGKDMRRHLIPPLGTVDTDSPHGVDGEPLVGVDSDTEEAGVGVDQPLDIALLQVEQHGGVIEVGQAGHVLATVILRRIDLNHFIMSINYVHHDRVCAFFYAFSVKCCRNCN